MQLNERDLATVLAALRYWQREGWVSSGHEHDIASNGGSLNPLTRDEIDDLCERLNCEEWLGSPDPDDPDNFWIDDETGERVNAHTGERTRRKT